jgi:uncharacterized protein YdiU (UPF0061 family)
MFYDGNQAYEPGAIVARVAPSFLRFGNFEMLASRNEIQNLTSLVDWTIDRFYPHIKGENKIIAWFKEVVERTAFLITEWLRVGFVHGVMNTDNMSILGVTIDYGPYSFLDDYDPNFTPNTTDLPGRRYAFGRQAAVAKWNLSCLAGAIAPLLSGEEELIEALNSYDAIYWKSYYTMMANKTGLDKPGPGDAAFFELLEKTLSNVKPDMTLFYQLLATLSVDQQNEQDIMDHFQEAFYGAPDPGQKEGFLTFIRTYLVRIKTNTCTREDAVKRMDETNPRFILRNYLLHQAIEELERGENTLFAKLEDAIRHPYSRDADEFFVKRPTWATQKAGCSMLSCSS